MTLTLRQLIEMTAGQVNVPAYQRRYVWGRPEPGRKDPAAYLTECLLSAQADGESLFLQGLALAKKPKDNDKGSVAYELVDGQQRLVYLHILLKYLGYQGQNIEINYDCRPLAQIWMDQKELPDSKELREEPSEDVYYFKKTIRTLRELLPNKNEINADWVLDNVYFLCMILDDASFAIGAYKMLNGSKQPMMPADIIKADIMRMASDPEQPNASDWELTALRARYADEWEAWARWWNEAPVREYYSGLSTTPMDLLLRLALRESDEDLAEPLCYEEFRRYIDRQDTKPYHAAKHFYYRLRKIQAHFEAAFADPATYNRIRAIILLQEQKEAYSFLYSYFVDLSMNADMLQEVYKLSFLGMDFSEIQRGDSPLAKFDDLLASMSMADVYHSEAKKDLFNLLLRLNIDEDIKLGRKFDFSIWNNRSLEHIYSKSKVWHRGPRGEVLDGNDNPIRMPLPKIMADPTYLSREDIVNHDGVQLSEHCIGNLVLLYGNNNASFGNAMFDEKKMMFLTPGDLGVFKSRNLLHSVCVFAGNNWTAQSIIDNYNLTLKNLKRYYGYK
ncbi:MAG: DUF262 domain-containing HNH endonuclease family protein [Bacteroidales bacterium]|nr:DUF262 domain-containing HNH endonuclease family protein [Bacteroidales bacterium]